MRARETGKGGGGKGAYVFNAIVALDRWVVGHRLTLGINGQALHVTAVANAQPIDGSSTFPSSRTPPQTDPSLCSPWRVSHHSYKGDQGSTAHQPV